MVRSYQCENTRQQPQIGVRFSTGPCVDAHAPHGTSERSEESVANLQALASSNAQIRKGSCNTGKEFGQMGM